MLGRLATKVLHRLPMRLQLSIGYRLSRIRRAMLGPYADAVLTNTRNGRLLVSSSDFVVGQSLAFEGRYDTESVDFLLEHITSDSNILVVGTHVGALLIPLAKKARRAVGIEANPETYRLLSMNVQLNDLTNVELHRFAAGDRNGSIQFLMSKHNTGGSKAIRDTADRNPLYYYDAPDTVTVPMRVLDEEFPGERFDLIVMDIEGSEYFALQGMPHILQDSRMLQIEVGAYFVENLGHTTLEDFVALIGKHFDKALVHGGPGGEPRTFARSDFPALVRELRGHYRVVFDVVFMKDSSTVPSPTAPRS